MSLILGGNTHISSLKMLLSKYFFTDKVPLYLFIIIHKYLSSKRIRIQPTLVTKKYLFNYRKELDNFE